MQEPQPEADLLDLVGQMRAGNQDARERLVSAIYERLNDMTRRMLRNAPAAVVRWDQTGDLLHSAWFRIERALNEDSVEFNDEAHLFRLIARHLRFQLIEIYRKNIGAYGIDANHGTIAGLRGAGNSASREASHYAWEAGDPTNDLSRLVAWGEFHQQVDQLPEREKAVVDLLWYQGLTQDKVAELLGVTSKTIQRSWRRAKIQLAEKLDEGMLGSR